MSVLRKFALLVLMSFSCLAISSAEWLPGDWKMSVGSYNTNVFSISTPDVPNFVLFDSKFYSAKDKEKTYEPQPGFRIYPDGSAYSVSSEYRFGRERFYLSGDIRIFQGDGTYFSIAAVPRQVMPSLVARIRLPFNGIQGKAFSLDGQYKGDLSVSGDVSFKAASVVFAEGFPSQTVIQLAGRLPWRLVKANEDGKDVINVFIDLTGDAAVQAGIPVFLTGRISSRDLPPRPYCSVTHAFNTKSVERYGLFEAAFQFLGVPVENPYDINSIDVTAVVVDESLNKYTVRPFYTVPYYQTGEKGDGTLASAGRPYFVARYCPRNSGKYTFRVFVGLLSNMFASNPIQFEVYDKSGGFVIRSQNDPRYLQLSSGEPYYPIGFNAAWLKPSLPSAYEALFTRMASRGINASRIWISSWGIRVDDATMPFGFNQVGLSTLDSVFASAANHGIKLILVLLNHEDINKNAEIMPFLLDGRTPVTKEDFFKLPKYRDQYKFRLRYFVSRFSPHSSLLAIEPGNELDYCIDTETLTDWYREMTDEIRKYDINRHLVTASLGFNTFDENFWKYCGADVTQFHGYTRDLAFIDSEYEKSALGMVDHAASLLLPFKQPAWMVEFGYAVTDDNPGFNDIDTVGLHLHNALWASLTSGLAGSSMNWWWESHILANDLLFNYSALARFVEGIDLPAQNFTISSDSFGSFKVRELKGKSVRLGWLSSDDNTWVKTLASSKEPFTHVGQQLQVSGLSRGYYRIEWWDTRKGVTVNEFSQRILDGNITLKIPDFAGDIAYRMFMLRTE